MNKRYYPYQLDGSISNFSSIWWHFFLSKFPSICFYTNSEGSDRTPHIAASDLGVHGLHSPLKGMLCLYGLSIRRYVDNTLIIC